MWDNPRLLNAVAGALTALALLVFAVGALQLLLRSPLFPLREIAVHGDLGHTTRAEIEQATQGRVSGNFFSVDLGTVRAALEALPWVRRVQVQRVWPDRLDVAFEEHVPLARWGDAALVNQQGERFAGRTEAPLPLFVGPPGAEGEVARQYLRFAAAVAPLGSALERVVLTPRFAWQLRLANGLHLMLGRDADQADARLRRFVAIYPSVEKNKQHEYVDLRYPNGFALRLPDSRS